MRLLSRALAMAALLVAVLLSPEAQVSQVFHESLSLEDVVRQSQAIVLGSVADPPHRVVSWTYPYVDPAGQAQEGSHSVVLQRITVTEVLRAPTAAPALNPGQLLEIHDPDAANGLSLSLMWETQGMSESPIYFTYQGGLNLYAEESKGAEVIAFLGRPQTPGAQQQNPEAWAGLAKALEGTWPLSVGGAVVAASERARVEAAMKVPEP